MLLAEVSFILWDHPSSNKEVNVTKKRHDTMAIGQYMIHVFFLKSDSP